MTTHRPRSSRPGLLRKAARASGALYLAYFFLIATARFLSFETQAPWKTDERGVTLTSVVFVAYVLAWRWPGLGGALGLGATLMFHRLEDLPMLGLIIMGGPGLLHLCAGLVEGILGCAPRPSTEGRRS